MISIEGTRVTQATLDFLRMNNIGGVILFSENISSAKQLLSLTEELQSAVLHSLFIAIDHEGGRVSRLSSEFTRFPPMRQIAAKASAEGDHIVEEVTNIMGTELLACGVNVNFAPVADVATNAFNRVIGDRSFGNDPKKVASLTKKAILGFESAGIMSCAKHFPGHGDTDLDSHIDFPVVAHTKKRFDLCEFVPFRAAIEQGVPSIMTAHLRAPLLDPTAPATISRKIVHGILRTELGFRDLIISDDLSMRGIAGLMPIPHVAARAIFSGHDMVLLRGSLDLAGQCLEAIHAAVKNGEIERGQVEASLARIAEAKSAYARSHLERSHLDVIGCGAHRKLAHRLFN